MPLVGVTDFESGVDGLSSIFLLLLVVDGVDAFDEVPDRGECATRSPPCSIFFINIPFSRGDALPLCEFGIGLIGPASDASSTTKS